MTSSEIRTWADSGETSSEIALAILNVAISDDDMLRLWADPTPDELTRILADAWIIADADEDELYWGCTTFNRPIS